MAQLIQEYIADEVLVPVARQSFSDAEDVRCIERYHVEALQSLLLDDDLYSK